MSLALTKLNTTSFNLLAFLDYCREEKQLNRNIDKIYEIVVYAFIETILKYLNPRVNVKFDREAKKLLKDFSLPKNLFWDLGTNALQFLQADCLPLDGTTLGKAIKIKYITLDEHAAPATALKNNYEKLIVICKDPEKTIIKNLTLQFGLRKNIHGFIPESTLVEWYHKCISPKYLNSVGKAVIKALNKKFKTEFPFTSLSPAMVAF